MVHSGHVSKGQIVLDQPLELPEGVSVRVEVETIHPSPTLLEQFKNVVGKIDDLPPDMALNHDHYLHGAPKR